MFIYVSNSNIFRNVLFIVIRYNFGDYGNVVLIVSSLVDSGDFGKRKWAELEENEHL